LFKAKLLIAESTTSSFAMQRWSC